MNEPTTTAEILIFQQSDTEIELPAIAPFSITKNENSYILTFVQNLLWSKDERFFLISVGVKSIAENNTFPTEDDFYNLYGGGVAKAREKANERWIEQGLWGVIDWPMPSPEVVKPDIRAAIQTYVQTTQPH